MSRSYGNLVGDGLFDLRVAGRLLAVALSSADTVHQYVHIRLVAMLDSGGKNCFGRQFDHMFLLARQVRVAFLHLHHAGIRGGPTFPLFAECLLVFTFPVGIPQVIIVVNLEAFSGGETPDVRLTVLASILANDRLHRCVGFQQG